MLWIWLVTTFCGGLLLGRAWGGFMVRYALRHDPEILAAAMNKWGVPGWTQQAEDEMNVRDEVLLASARWKRERAERAARDPS